MSYLSKIEMSSFVIINGKGGQDEKGDYQDEQRRVKAVGSDSQSD